MKKNLKLFSVVFILLLSSDFSTQTLVKDQSHSENQVKQESAEKNPTMAILFSKAGRLKILARKSAYHLGESLLIDVAIFNTTETPKFYPVIDVQNLLVHSQLGRKVSVNPYSITNGERPFTFIERNQFYQAQLHLIVGCTDDLFSRRDNLLNAKDNIAIFDADLFVSIGDACLDVKAGDVISVSALIDNNNILITDDVKNALTAIGKTQSNQIKVRILN